MKAQFEGRAMTSQLVELRKRDQIIEEAFLSEPDVQCALQKLPALCGDRLAHAAKQLLLTVGSMCPYVGGLRTLLEPSGHLPLEHFAVLLLCKAVSGEIKGFHPRGNHNFLENEGWHFSFTVNPSRPPRMPSVAEAFETFLGRALEGHEEHSAISQLAEICQGCKGYATIASAVLFECWPRTEAEKAEF